MADVELTNRMRATLTTLINEYQATDAPIKAETIAERLDRNPGTIRNQMQTLKSVGVAEGVPGPKGGYRPTEKGYDELDRQQLEDATAVTFASEFDRISATVDDIDFTNVHHPDRCRAHVHFQQSIERKDVGQTVLLGPTPVSNLVLGGEVVTVDASNNVIIVDVIELQAPIQEDGV